MKLDTLNVNNFGGVRAANIHLAGRPVTLIAGHNYAGKSFLANAIKTALTGATERVKLKKDFNQLVRDGAKSSSIRLNAGGHEYGFDLPKGKWTENELADVNLPLVLDIRTFASLPDAEKRRVIFRITGLNPTPEAISKRMIELGCESGLVEKIAGMLVVGLDEAHREARQQITTKKGAWGQTTGTTWGSDKAQDWKAERPDFNPEAETKLRAELDELNALRDSTANQLMLLENDYRENQQQMAAMTALLEKASMLQRLQKKLDVDEAELQRCTEQYEETRRLAGDVEAQDAYPCPCCGERLALRNGALVSVGESVDPDPEALRRLPEQQKAVELMRRTVAKDKELVEEAQNAKTKLAEAGMPKDRKSSITQHIDDLRIRLNAFKSERATIEANLFAAQSARMKNEQALSAESTAAGLHADIMAWSKVAEHLAPDGVIAEFLANALKAVNERLRQSSLDTGWLQVAIDADMTITAGGRLYSLLSESEQWRADAMIAEAISHLSGLRLLILDRMDLLVPHARGELLSWLDILADAGEVDTAVVCATLKEPPARLPASVQLVWMQDGEIAHDNKPTIQRAA